MLAIGSGSVAAASLPFLIDIVARHAVFREDLIRHVLDNRVARDSDVLVRELFCRLRRLRRARDELVAAVRVRRDIHVKAAVFRERDGEHIRHIAIERAALQRRVAIHRALELLELDFDAFLFEIAVFLCDEER